MMTRRRFGGLLACSLLPVPLLKGRPARAADEAAAAPAPAPAPVTDPVCVAWEKGCVVHRYSVAEGKWSTHDGPRAVLPLKVVPAVGRHAVAALDPTRGHAGWLFDLHGGKWTPVPKSPVSGHGGGVGERTTAAFVGDQLVVWGRIQFGAERNDQEGAVLDTRTMTWRPMAAAPIVPRHRCVKVVVGDRLLVWGGYGPLGQNRIGPLADGAAYDVAKDAWDKIPDPPVPGRRYGGAAAAWNGRMVLFGGRDGRGFVDVGVIYDPATRAWEKMKAPPVGVGVNATAAVCGDQFLVWSGSAGDGSGVSPEGAVYDLRRRRWDRLPPAPIPPRSLAFAKAHDEAVTVWGGWLSADFGAEFLPDGATYDLARQRWQAIPPMPGKVPYELHPGW